MSSSKVLLLALCLNALFLLCTSTYEVRDNGVVCLLLDLTATMKVTYNSSDGTHIVPREALVNVVPKEGAENSFYGECVDEAGLLHDDQSVQLNMTLPDSSTLNVTFYKAPVIEEGVNVTRVFLDRVIYEYDTTNNPNYINPVTKGKVTVTIDYMGYNLGHAGNYYSCSDERVLTVSQDTHLVMQFVKVQIIDIVNNTYSDFGEECQTDNSTSSTVAPPTTTTDITDTTTVSSTTTTTTTTTTTVSPNTTTVSPNTTTVSPNTTTMTPSTTTMTPSTTTVSPNTTTVSPNTTTVSPNTTTMTPSTTTMTPSTTPAPEPSTTTSIIPTPTGKPSPNATYFVVDEKTKNVCLLVKFSAINFTIAYNKADKKKDYATVQFNPAKASGSCQDKSEEITFSWRPTTMPADIAKNWNLTLGFFKVTPKKLKSRLQADSESAYALKKVSLFYIIDSTTFPNPETEKAEKTLESSEDESRFQTPVGQTYRCDSKKTVNLQGEDFKMLTQDFEIEAFRHSNTTTFDNKDLMRCSEDETAHSPLVPIVVGVVLMLLVIIVLVAYFVIRRRNRMQNAYEQI